MIRILHTDVCAFRKLVVITSDWHMPRTKAVCDFVFGFNAHELDTKYTVEYRASDSMLPMDVLEARLTKEKRDLPRYKGVWQKEVLCYGSNVAALHKWMFAENYAYCSKRLLCSRNYPDAALAQSY
jgi:hypothetical protein